MVQNYLKAKEDQSEFKKMEKKRSKPVTTAERRVIMPENAEIRKRARTCD